ncbi:DUF4116 domain-containing protein [Aquirufa sp. A-Brett2-15D]
MMEEKQYLMEEVSRDRHAYQWLSDEWRADVDVARGSIEKFGTTLAFAPLWMKADRELALLAVKANGLAIEFVHPDLVKSDLEICIKAVENETDVMDLLSPEMRMKEEVLLALLNNDWGYRPFKDQVPDTLLRNKAFMKQVVAINGRMLEMGSSRISMDPEIASIAALNCGRFAFKHLEECYAIPQVMEVLEGMQEECENLMDQYLLEKDPEKREYLYWEVMEYDSYYGIRSSRSQKYAYSENEEVNEEEPKGIRFFMMSHDVSMAKTAGPDGQDPLRIDALFHSENTSFGGWSYALSQQLKEKLHLQATLVSTPLIDRSSEISIQQQARSITKDILATCKQNSWHRIRLTNFTYLKSSQFETFLGIGLEIEEQKNDFALTIYMDIDPEFVKGKYGDQLDLIETK